VCEGRFAVGAVGEFVGDVECVFGGAGLGTEVRPFLFREWFGFLFAAVDADEVTHGFGPQLLIALPIIAPVDRLFVVPRGRGGLRDGVNNLVQLEVNVCVILPEAFVGVWEGFGGFLFDLVNVVEDVGV
jgi:hypothetical protein